MAAIPSPAGLYTSDQDRKCACGRWCHADKEWCCRPFVLARGPFRTTSGVLIDEENIGRVAEIIYPEELAEYVDAGLVARAPRCAGEDGPHSNACRMRQMLHSLPPQEP